MPDIEVCDLYQTAVLWPFTVYNDSGDPLVDVDNPVELEVRWIIGRKEDYDPKGNKIVIDALVVVDRRIEIDSLMWLGELDDIPGTGTGFAGESNELMRVAIYREIIDLKGRAIRRTVGLQRYRDNLPTDS